VPSVYMLIARRRAPVIEEARESALSEFAEAV
jgi:hypothetical protein